MENYKVSEIAKILNVKIDTIRYYEKIGLIPSPKRLENNYRVYSKEYIDLIKFIQVSKDVGFTLNQIKDLINLIASPNDNSITIKDILHNKVLEIDSRINKLNMYKKSINNVLECCDLKNPSLSDFIED